MPSRYPITLQGPNETAALPEVKRLVFDHLAERQHSGVEVIAVERMLLAHGYHPGAAKVILAEFRKAGALSERPATHSTTYYRLRALAPTWTSMRPRPRSTGRRTSGPLARSAYARWTASRSA